jgi:ubiquinone/menaquinone biosynthesis C-methylase UbiE
MTDPMSRANNLQMGDDFAAVYEAAAHRITGPVSNIALDIMGVGPGTRILDIAAGAGALSGPAAERGGAVLATDIAPGMVRRLAERLRPFHRCEAREMDGEALAVPDAGFDAAFSIFGVILFEDWRRGLREQARVLRSEGKACVATWGEPPGGGPLIAMSEALRSVFSGVSSSPPPSGMVALCDADRGPERGETCAGILRVVANESSAAQRDAGQALALRSSISWKSSACPMYIELPLCSSTRTRFPEPSFGY